MLLLENNRNHFLQTNSVGQNLHCLQECILCVPKSAHYNFVPFIIVMLVNYKASLLINTHQLLGGEMTL